MLVVLVLAVIVLIGGVALYMETFPKQGSQVSEQGKVSECCGEYVRKGGCTDSGITMEEINEDVDSDCTEISDPTTACCGGAS